MRHLLIAVVLALVGGGIGSAGSDEVSDPDIYRNELAQFEIRQPHGWHFESAATRPEKGAVAKLSAEERQKALDQLVRAPLLISFKHPEPYDNLNPALKVLVRPLQSSYGETAVKQAKYLLTALKLSMAKAFTGVSMVEDIHECRIAGQEGARMKARYTKPFRDGRHLPSQATVVVLPRGTLYFEIGIAAPPEGDDSLDQQLVDDILDSVKFLD